MAAVRLNLTPVITYRYHYSFILYL